MNKGRRQELTKLKFKKRLRDRGFTLEYAKQPNVSLYCFKSDRQPCSCSMCRDEKYRASRKTQKQKFERLQSQV